MNKILSQAAGASLFRLRKMVEKDLLLMGIFLRTEGVYVIHCELYHEEDVGFEHAETVSHYITFNAGTGALYLYPEVLVVTNDDREDLVGFFGTLEQAPFLLKMNYTEQANKWARRVAVIDDGSELYGSLPLAPMADSKRQRLQ